MAFTYAGTLSSNLDKVRFHIRDVTENSGPRPADANFTDAELGGLVTANETWQRAVAAALRVLATEWVRYPTFKADGLTLNRTRIAEGFTAQAEAWEKRFGIAVPVKTAGIIRVDGWSDDVPNDDVSGSSEYGLNWEYVVPK